MTDDKRLSDNKKRLLICILVVVFALTLVGGTFAYIITSINVLNGNYISRTHCFEIVYNNINADGTVNIAGTLEPSNNYKGGLTGNMSIGNNCGLEGLGNLLMHVNEDSSILTKEVPSHCESTETLETLTQYTTEGSCLSRNGTAWITDGSALKYIIYEGNTSNFVSSGHIKTTGVDVKIYEDFDVPTYGNLLDLRIYIWLDGNLINDNSYTSINLAGYLYPEVNQVVQSSNEPNAPELDDGMIPVTISDDGTVTVVSSDDPNWYNYSNKKWANVVLVKEDATEGNLYSSRSYYKNNIGETVSRDDILAYYVWIPRYKYRIPFKCSDIDNPTIEAYPECYTTVYNLLIDDDEIIEEIYSRSQYDISCMCGDIVEDEEGNISMPPDCKSSIISDLESYGIYNDYCGNVEFSVEELADSEYERVVAFNEDEIFKTVDILFESKDASFKKGNAVDTYYTHPSFWWDDDNDNYIDSSEMLPGIWVGKFETSPDPESDCYSDYEECNNSIQNPRIIPFANSLSYQNIGNQFYTSKNFSKLENIYGLNSNNINSHVMKNRDWGAVTYLSHSKYGINKGVGNNDGYMTGCGVGEFYVPYTCLMSYGFNSSNYPQSTTGNISGIFDMSGGNWESVMLYFGNNAKENSVVENIPEIKYYDYLTLPFSKFEDCSLGICGGHAFYEINQWYEKDYYNYGMNQWAVRGGKADDSGLKTKISSLYSRNYDNILEFPYTWRSVLVPGFKN